MSAPDLRGGTSPAARYALICWVDAAGQDERVRPADLKRMTPITMVSVGWLVLDHPEYVTLVMDWWWDEPDGHVTWRNWLAIPRPCIVTMVVLEAPADMALPVPGDWPAGGAP